MKPTRAWLIILLVALAYGAGHLAWYAGTPLGQVPVLDEQENLRLATQIATGTLPAEPFYRAMGYPLLLAGLLRAGVAAAQLPLAALVLGVMLHALGAGLAGAVARRWFDDARAGLIAGLLFALNPVFVHFATQRLDAALAVGLFLAGLLALPFAAGGDRPPARPPSAGAAPLLALSLTSVCWALAALTRPQFLTVWVALPVLWLWRHRTRAGLRAALVAVGAGAVLFVAEGLWQRSVGGEFHVSPWQGAYNLWAANQPGAHGRYYTQQLDLSQANSRANPAQLESILLYQRETGRTDHDIAAMNAHWSQKLRERILRHPLDWLGQLGRKTYALLNDWEQYNNKTYAFHQARSPWLRPNPLGWGLLFVLGVAGAWRLHGVDAARARLFAGIAAACAGGIVLGYVSARFRLPLAALLCVLAGGALAQPLFWRRLGHWSRLAFAVAFPLAAIVTFSNLDGVRDRRPIVQDQLLLARAAQEAGDDATAWSAACAALALAPDRRDADEYVVTSGFNRLLTGTLSPAENTQWRASARHLLTPPAAGGDAARIIAATITRDPAVLRTLDTANDTGASDALGALALLGVADAGELARLRAAPWDAGSTLYLMARQADDPAGFSAWARAHRPPGWGEALAAARARLLAAN